MDFVYHRVPPNFQGKFIYPLNQLRDTHPEIYSQQVAKYKGRESLLQKRIKPLDCLWNDVIFFSPVHPSKIYEKLGELRAKHSMAKFFQIPAELLQIENTVVQIPVIDIAGKAVSETFQSYSADSLGTLSQMPQQTVNYFTAEVNAGRQPFHFAGIPHILYKGALDISKLEVISV